MVYRHAKPFLESVSGTLTHVRCHLCSQALIAYALKSHTELVFLGNPFGSWTSGSHPCSLGGAWMLKRNQNQTNLTTLWGIYCLFISCLMSTTVEASRWGHKLGPAHYWLKDLWDRVWGTNSIACSSSFFPQIPCLLSRSEHCSRQKAYWSHCSGEMGTWYM